MQVDIASCLMLSIVRFYCLVKSSWRSLTKSTRLQMTTESTRSKSEYARMNVVLRSRIRIKVLIRILSRVNAEIFDTIRLQRRTPFEVPIWAVRHSIRRMVRLLFLLESRPWACLLFQTRPDTSRPSLSWSTPAQYSHSSTQHPSSIPSSVPH